ncbi:MAG: PAS domain S-box protein, partial [Holophaga sp.]|nr:PAS domain S-box protein [Holophaga sp.]
MTSPLSDLFPDRSLARLVVVRAALWTLLVGLFLGLGLYYSRREALDIALNRAKDSYRKDVTYRLWATQRGGVYVPLDEKTPANPYLAFIPDREITTTKGKVYTLVNPAYMTRMVHELGAKEYGLRGHLTSLNPIRPENAADSWERKALQKFEMGSREYWEKQNLKGESHLRYMGAFVVEQGCLRCHASQGYQLGQVRGGISVSVPIQSGVTIAGVQDRVALASLGSLWAIGLVAIVLVARQQKRDAKDRKSALDEVQVLAQQHQAMLQTTRDGFWVIDQAGNLRDVNEVYVRMSGYSRAELLTMNIRDLDAKLTHLEISEHAQLAKAAGWDRFESLHRTKQGELIDVEVSDSFNEATAQFVVFIRDITTRKLASRELRESEALLRTYFDAAPDGIFVINGQGRYLQVNKAAEAMTGYSREELLRMAIQDLGTPDPEGNRASFDILQKDGSVLQEIALRRKDGSHFPVLLRAAKIHDDLSIGLCRDITEQKQMEANHQKMELEIQHAKQLESLGSLAGGIAHDMNNVLAAIMGLGSVLQFQLAQDPPLLKSVDTILHAAGRGRDLVKGLTDFARKGLQEPQLLDL